MTLTSGRQWWPILCKTCHRHNWCCDLHVYNRRLFFFCFAPSFWLNFCRIRQQWRTSFCPAAALRRQRQRHRYSPPLHTDLRANPERFDPVLHSEEHHHFERRVNFASKDHWVIHILGKVETNAVQYPFTSLKSCRPPPCPLSRGDTSDGVVCDKLTETNRSWAWAELRMWHAALCSDDPSVGNVLGGIRRGGNRSHSCLAISCVFFFSTLVWRLDRSGETRCECHSEEQEACGKCEGHNATLTSEKEHLACWGNCKIFLFGPCPVAFSWQSFHLELLPLNLCLLWWKRQIIH